MQLSQLLNMTVPTSPIQGKSVADESEKNGGDNGLFDSLLEMYISPDKLKNSGEGLSEKLFSKSEKILDEKTNDLIKTISKLDSEDFINEIKDSLNLADEKTIFFFDNKNGNVFRELIPNPKISQKQIDNLVNFISTFKFGNKKAIISDLEDIALSKDKISEFVQKNNFIFKLDENNVLTFKKIKNGQFLIERNSISLDNIENLESKQNGNHVNKVQHEILNQKIQSNKNDFLNKVHEQNHFNASKTDNKLEGSNAQYGKNLFHLNEFNSKETHRKNLVQSKIESSEDVLFLKNKFNNQKPNLNSLNKYIKFSDKENFNGAINEKSNGNQKETKIIDGLEKFNFNQKSQIKNTQVNLNQEIKVPQSGKNENLEALMNNESNNSGDNSAPKISFQNNKIPNINRDFSIGNTIPLEISSESNSLEALANRVGEYIKGHYNKSDENLSLTVKHDLIGKFKLDVTENADKTIDIKILTGTDDGKLFFARNESEISNNLKNLGLKISEMKIIAGSDSMNESNNSFDSEKNQSSENGKGSKYSNQDESKKDDSDRRKELWERYKERMDS